MDGNGVAGIITHNYHGSFPIFPTFSTSKILRCRESGQAHVALPVEVGAAPRSAEAGGRWVSSGFLKCFYRGFNGKLASFWDVDGLLEDMTSTKVKAWDVDEALNVSRL